jgi:hypothetical protein
MEQYQHMVYVKFKIKADGARFRKGKFGMVKEGIETGGGV